MIKIVILISDNESDLLIIVSTYMCTIIKTSEQYVLINNSFWYIVSSLQFN